MSLGLLLSSLSLYLAFRSAPTAAAKKEDIWLAAFVGSFYCTAGLSAILYPGTAWTDPEFAVKPEGMQGYMFAVQVTLVWTAYAIARSTLSKSKTT